MLMDFINEDKTFQRCIKNVCVYCMKIKKYQYLKIIYPNIHDDIYNNTKDVIYFIKKYSSADIIPYPITKIIAFEEYKKAYKDRHIKICEYYGDFNPNIYEKSFKKIESLIDEESEKDKLNKKIHIF